MVDAENLILDENFMQPGVQNLRALKVGSEGLLHHDARPLYETGRGEQLDRRQSRVRRHAQIVKSLAVGAQMSLGALNRVRQR